VKAATTHNGKPDGGFIAATTHRIVDIAPTSIVASPLNHRKRFTGIEELAESLKAHGMLSPVTVRRTPSGLPAFELVVGERRWRAAGPDHANLSTIPCIVRELDDKQVLEIQLIENVQRSDVHALEEADGYKELLDKHGYTADQLAAKIGKSKAYVYARLKLCALGPVPRKAFLEDKLNPSVALMIARIPDAKLQTEAPNAVLGRGDWKTYGGTGVRGHDVEDENGKREDIPLSVREASLYLQRKYMLRLEQAPFDLKDEKLVEKAGSCAACPKRTGNQRELFSDVRSADVCTDPACFESKKKADWDQKAAAAQRAGMRVLSAKETKSVFESWNGGTGIQHSSAYVDPKDKVPYDIDPSRKKTWGSLLGKDTKVAKAIAQDGAGAARELVVRSSAIAELKKSGKLKEAKTEGRALSRGNDKYKQEQARKQKDAKRRHAIAKLAFAELERKGREASGSRFWQWLAAAVLEMIDEEDRRNLCKRRGIDAKMGMGQSRSKLGAIVKETKTVDGLLGLIVEFAASYHSVGGMWAGTGFGKNFTGACAALDVDLKKLGTEVAKADKAKKTPAPAKKGGKARG
jgi:ParB/RepB/Spo0J family partition protein